jgi:membrane-associated phospholipid phosphatase
VTSLLLVACLAAPSKTADDRSILFEDVELPPLEWKASWGDFSTGEWVITGFAAATALAHMALGPQQLQSTGGWWIDDDVRNALRAGNEAGRNTARDISDVLLTVTSSYPFVVDAMVVAGWHRRSPETGRMMGLINLEAMAISISITQVVKSWVGRERPYGRTCGTELAANNDFCSNERGRYYSFFSGHTSQAFTAAALTCSHQLNLNLYNNRAAEITTCGIGLGLATLTGALRIVGDQHYTTDVLMGAAVGSLTGFLVPWLAHYRFDEDPEPSTGLDVAIVPMGVGVGVVGVW